MTRHVTLDLLEILRDRAQGEVRSFIDAALDVLSIGDRFVLRTPGRILVVDLDQMLIGPSGIGVADSDVMIRFDRHLRLAKGAPAHFHMTMPIKIDSGIYRPDAPFVEGVERTFCMLSRDDEQYAGTVIEEETVRTLEAISDTRGPGAIVRVGYDPRTLTDVRVDWIGVIGGCLSIPTLDIHEPWTKMRGCVFGLDERSGISIGMTDGRRLALVAK